ncbi:MAG: hypothetical protein ACXWIN_08575 [Burkholderiaceae bacterium]
MILPFRALNLFNQSSNNQSRQAPNNSAQMGASPSNNNANFSSPGKRRELTIWKYLFSKLPQTLKKNGGATSIANTNISTEPSKKQSQTTFFPLPYPPRRMNKEKWLKSLSNVQFPQNNSAKNHPSRMSPPPPFKSSNLKTDDAETIRRAIHHNPTVVISVSTSSQRPLNWVINEPGTIHKIPGYTSPLRHVFSMHLEELENKTQAAKHFLQLLKDNDVEKIDFTVYRPAELKNIPADLWYRVQDEMKDIRTVENFFDENNSTISQIVYVEKGFLVSGEPSIPATIKKPEVQNNQVFTQEQNAQSFVSARSSQNSHSYFSANSSSRSSSIYDTAPESLNESEGLNASGSNVDGA